MTTVNQTRFLRLCPACKEQIVATAVYTLGLADPTDDWENPSLSSPSLTGVKVFHDCTGGISHKPGHRGLGPVVMNMTNPLGSTAPDPL